MKQHLAPSSMLLTLFLLQRAALGQHFCTESQWSADNCPWKWDRQCDVGGVQSFCSSGTDCGDCDPCKASFAGYGGCGHCVATDGCSWCKSSGQCVSTAATTFTEDGELVYPCDSQWQTDTCDASEELVAGRSFNDPAAQHQSWFLEAINVGAAWALGYTGTGVNILFRADALDIEHSDIRDKYNAAGSPVGRDPMPSGDETGAFGTAMVGFAAATANNNACGVGVAYDSTVSFAKFDVPIGDILQLGVDNNVNHVYCHPSNWARCEPDSLNGPRATGFQPYNVPTPTNQCPFDNAAYPCSTVCLDWPGFVDSTGDTCSTYESNNYCTSSGGLGSGWQSSWGSIESYANSDGLSALDSCCACGGGINCRGMDWTGDSISDGCVTMIRVYCFANLASGEGQGIYDPACADHWDLYVDCQHMGLSYSENVYLQEGVQNGRGGKGIVYVFASGNGFDEGENVNMDGFRNSIFTISVAATALDGKHAFYSSAGAPVLISAPGGETHSQSHHEVSSNGEMSSAKSGSSDGCGDAGVSTGSSAALVSGVVALMLEANSNLGWRDVQDILVRTAATTDSQHTSWVRNGAGLRHSDLYGFGLVDAGAAVVMARDWASQDSKEHALLGRHVAVDLLIPSDDHGIQCGVTIAQTDASHMESVEHVVIYITTSSHEARGELQILLTSPAGMESLMTWTSSTDSAAGDFENFKFMTVKNWGETAQGTWTLQVMDARDNGNEGKLVSWILAIYGKCSGSASGNGCRRVMSPAGNQVFDTVDGGVTVADGAATCEGATTTTTTTTTTAATTTSATTRADGTFLSTPASTSTVANPEDITCPGGLIRVDGACQGCPEEMEPDRTQSNCVDKKSMGLNALQITLIGVGCTVAVAAIPALIKIYQCTRPSTGNPGAGPPATPTGSEPVQRQEG